MHSSQVLGTWFVACRFVLRRALFGLGLATAFDGWRVAVLGVGWLVAAIPQMATAQPAAEAPKAADRATPATAAVAAPSGLSAPELIEPVEPEFPASMRGAVSVQSEVGLVLRVGVEGQVEEAVVTASAGEEFDRAALVAAKRLRFKPASRDGQAVVARIPFRFRFAYQAPTVAPAAVAAAAQRGNLQGTLRTPADGALPGATLTLIAADGTRSSATSDAAGKFAWSGLPAGRYRLEVRAAGFQSYDVDEDVAAGEATEVTYRLNTQSDGDVQEITVLGKQPPREATRIVLEQRELQRVPGTNGDSLRALESLPGVARPPLSQPGYLLIRGAGPNDSGIYLDGTQIPIAFHFGGLSSVLPTEVIERLNFLPGNFGAEYGRAMGGIVDIGLRSPAKDKIHGVAKIDVLDARLLIETPLGKRARMLLAGRRSWIDAWIGPVLSAGGGTSVTAAPVYYDYQGIFEFDLTRRTTLRVSGVGSFDKLRLVLNAPEADDPGINGPLSNRTVFYRVQARTDTRFNARTRWLNTIAYGRDRTVFGVGKLDIDIQNDPLTLRSDLRTQLHPMATLVAGVDTVINFYDVDVTAPPIPEDNQDDGSFFALPPSRQTANPTRYQPGLYTMLELSPLRPLKLLPSMRVDYASDINVWSFSPRFAFRYDVHSAYRRTTLKGGVGLYHQPPQPYESFRPFGVGSLNNNRALHYSFGVEQEITRQLEASAEGFYKRLDDLVDQRPDATNSQAGVTYNNDGDGRIYGGEFLVRYRPDKRFFGWIAYTISRSERRFDGNPDFRTFDYDQTHIFSALGSYRLGRGWEIGARWRYVSGNPSTPVVSAVYDADAGAYAPVLGTPFSNRDSAFHRLDVRVDKTWEFAVWKLTAYLDIQNLYNRANQEGFMENYNYTQQRPINGLPIIPVIGVRGEL